jgi:MFS family permease
LRARAETRVAGWVAPALGGLLSGLYGTRVPLLLDAATFCAVTVAAVLLQHRRAVAAPAGERLRGGLAIAARNPLLRSVLVLLAASALLGSLVNVVEVFLVRETLHAGAIWYGLAGAAYMAGLLVGALAAGRFGSVAAQGRWFVAATGALSVGLILMGLAPGVGALLAFAAATGSANGVLNVCMATLVMGTAEPGERGRLGALVSGVASGAQLAAYAASGALAVALSPRAIFVAAGCAGLLGPLLFGRAVVRAAAGPKPAESAGPVESVRPTSRGARASEVRAAPASDRRDRARWPA